MKTVKARVKGLKNILVGSIVDNNFLVPFDHDRYVSYPLSEVEIMEKEFVDALDKAADDIVWGAIDTNDTTIIKYEGLLRYLVRAGADWQLNAIKKSSEIVDKDFFAHLKESWRQEGYLEGKLAVKQAIYDCKDFQDFEKTYMEQNKGYIESTYDRHAGLIDGAEWQRAQMMDEWLKDRDGCFWDGVNKGKKAMEEQMMKEAITCKTEIFYDDEVGEYRYSLILPTDFVNPRKYVGDFKIIVLKDDEADTEAVAK